MLTDRQEVKLKLVTGLLSVLADKGHKYCNDEFIIWLDQTSERLTELILPLKNSEQHEDIGQAE